MMYRILLMLAFICIADSLESKTDCQEHRERELRTNAPLPLQVIPECDEDGNYKPRQCVQDGDFCACWDKSGNPFTQQSKKIKACECLLEKHELQMRGRRIGAFDPNCTEDGKYHNVQCHGSTGHCWCADPETGERTSEKIRGVPDC